MKIGMVAPAFSAYGATRMIENLALGLRELGLIVEILSFYGFKNTKTEALFINENIPIHYLNKKIGFDLNIIKRINKVIKLNEYDVVHSHQSALRYLIFSKEFWRVKKRIHTIHSMVDKEDKGVTRLVNLIAFKNDVTPVGVSSLVSKSIRSAYGISATKMIANGIKITLLGQSKADLRKKYGIKEAEIVFIFLGRLTEAKNIFYVIKLFKEINAVQANSLLLIVGDGEQRGKLIEEIRKYQLETKVMMFGERTDSMDILGASDFFLMPSLWEGLPMALLEAMGQGKVCFVSKVGGIGEVVQDEYNAIIINNSNIEEASGKIIKVIQAKRDDIKNIENNAIETIKEKYSYKIMANKYYEVYKE